MGLGLGGLEIKVKFRYKLLFTAIVGVQFVLLGGVNEAHAGSTLDAVRARGKLLCSTAGNIYAGRVDYAKPGNMSGFNRDFCRAIAAATLADGSAVKFIPLVPKNRFQALQEGAIDVLIRSTTWTLIRDSSLGVHFAAVNFYDGQGFLAAKSLGIKSLSELRKKGKKATVCVEKNTTTIDNVKEYIRTHDLPIKVIGFNAFEEARYAFIDRRCDLFTADRSFLMEVRVDDTPKPDNYIILQDIISKEPLAAAVRDNDPQWFNIVRWSVYATIQAEELGITSANVDALRKDGSTPQRLFLGANPSLGKALGLNDDWAYQIVKSVGNYGEIFERNLGKGTVYNIKRGINDLWTRGGLMYSPPFH